MDIINTYRQGTARGATSVSLVGLLYEQMVNDLRGAMQAIEEGNVELRTRQINHAILVLGHLQTVLNECANRAVADHLDAFYNQIRFSLMRAQATVSKDLLSRQITDLLCVRGAWADLERRETLVLPESSKNSVTGPADMTPLRLNTEV